MTSLPANVIRLDQRRPRAAPDLAEDEPVAMPRGRHLRVVGHDATLFRLDVFLARARVIMAECDMDAPAAPVVPLHRRPA
jgi:hypothetical protein